MILRIGMCGSHRTGKTTLAEAVSRKMGIPFVRTETASVFRQRGLNPSGHMDFKTRISIQHSILDAAQAVWDMEKGNFVTDRTPFDMMAYTLGDIRGDTAADFPELDEYLTRCFDAANETFSLMFVIQPGIPLVYESGKAPLNRAYMEHLNIVIKGLLPDGRNRCPSLKLERSMTDIDERVVAVQSMAAIEQQIARGVMEDLLEPCQTEKQKGNRKNMKVTQEEREIIYALRAKSERTRELEKKRIRILQCAAEFEEWRQGNGAGTSFMTFLDDFGYNDEGKDAKSIWLGVCSVLQAVIDTGECSGCPECGE